MSTHDDIEKDPYAHAQARILHSILKPILQVFISQETAKERIESTRQQLEHLAQDAETEYFTYLSRIRSEVQLDHGPRPINFIQAQTKYPKLRKLYVARRVAKRVADDFTRRAERAKCT